MKENQPMRFQQIFKPASNNKVKIEDNHEALDDAEIHLALALSNKQEIEDIRKKQEKMLELYSIHKNEEDINILQQEMMDDDNNNNINYKK